MADILWPSSCISSTARWFHFPTVLTASGINIWLLASCLYLASLVLATLSAAAPAMVAVSVSYELAYVSGTVTSHARGFPLAEVSSVTPSGRLPLSRVRPTGSFIAGTCALLNARLFSWLWCWCLVALLRHSKPWSPRALICPQILQVGWFCHMIIN